jgi:hypothetical protein
VVYRVIDLLRIDVQSLIGLAWLRGIRVALPHGVADSQDNKQHGGGNDVEQQSYCSPRKLGPFCYALANRIPYCPVPDRLATCGLLLALSVNVNVPVAVPETIGPNVTPTVQLAPAATVVPQVLVATTNPVLAKILLTVRLVLM